ncbi:hypothetical protein Fcan01_17462 [Folsomia candida]|uniref:F-box domain-containing protein n=1 Tax=Folsomia candida TaxID=158441 RepID=A0A226DRC7_FOLCA|nr:hypothetical protein Fcan01_17462 [Folsomia candida]
MNQAEEMDPVNLAFANQLIFDKIRTFLPKLGPTLRLVCKTWNDRILSSSRPKLVLKLCCPNLKNLRIMEWTLTPSERGEETSLAWGRLPVRPNLVELHIETSKRRNEGVVRLRELTQLLVNSAPALRLVIVPDYVEFEDLKVKGNVKVIRQVYKWEVASGSN